MYPFLGQQISKFIRAPTPTATHNLTLFQDLNAITLLTKQLQHIRHRPYDLRIRGPDRCGNCIVGLRHVTVEQIDAFSGIDGLDEGDEAVGMEEGNGLEGD